MFLMRIIALSDFCYLYYYDIFICCYMIVACTYNELLYYFDCMQYDRNIHEFTLYILPEEMCTRFASLLLSPSSHIQPYIATFSCRSDVTNKS